jgi:hypothetical protein
MRNIWRKTDQTSIHGHHISSRMHLAQDLCWRSLSGHLVSTAALGGSSIAEIGLASPPEATDMPQVDPSGPVEVDLPAASAASARGSSAGADGSHAHADLPVSTPAHHPVTRI